MAESKPRRGGRADSPPTGKGKKKKKKAATPTAGKGTEKAAKPTAQKAPPTPVGERVPIVEHLGPRLREELDAVSRSEAKILRALRREDAAEEFVRDPAAALRRMKVDVPPIMAARLKEPSPLAGLLAPRSYQLPNGQVVTARVRVHLTAGEPGTRPEGEKKAPGPSNSREG